jgi:hypothetical protein
MAAGNDSGNVAPRDIAVDFRAIPPPKKKIKNSPNRTAQELHKFFLADPDKEEHANKRRKWVR